MPCCLRCCRFTNTLSAKWRGLKLFLHGDQIFSEAEKWHFELKYCVFRTCNCSKTYTILKGYFPLYRMYFQIIQSLQFVGCRQMVDRWGCILHLERVTNKQSRNPENFLQNYFPDNLYHKLEKRMRSSLNCSFQDPISMATLFRNIKNTFCTPFSFFVYAIFDTNKITH